MYFLSAISVMMFAIAIEGIYEGTIPKWLVAIAIYIGVCSALISGVIASVKIDRLERKVKEIEERKGGRQ